MTDVPDVPETVLLSSGVVLAGAAWAFRHAPDAAFILLVFAAVLLGGFAVLYRSRTKLPDERGDEL